MAAEYIDAFEHPDGSYEARASSTSGAIYTSQERYPTADMAYEVADRWLDAACRADHASSSRADEQYLVVWLEIVRSVSTKPALS